jgi:hypothetical protein
MTQQSYLDAPSMVLDATRSILVAYGVDCATEAETRARVGVLDRMGAFAWSERSILKQAGLL